VTVLEAIQKSTEFLGKKNIESPRLQCELLLAHVLKMPRLKLYLNFERPLTSAETNTLRELIKRRGQREPLQHITGSTSFCGFEIAVNRSVLVPRPETELLAELGWQFLNQLSEGRVPRVPDSTVKIQIRDSQSSSLRALDFCTGSGCIAIGLAAKCPDAQIVATDISADAVTLAKENAARNNVVERIQFLQGDGFGAFTNFGLRRHVGALESGDMSPHSKDSTRHAFDLIISNPPYIPSAEIATLEPEVRDFDPRVALDGGADGLDFYRLIASQAGAFLKQGGKIMVEFGDGQAEAIRKIFETEKWIVEAVKEDYSQRARIIIAKSSSSSPSSSK
jgi:release factor glutamine methyltransferase